ncbi:MAG: hypothetical protein ACI4GC_05640 [Acutalibacteraceae bacterium]
MFLCWRGNMHGFDVEAEPEAVEPAKAEPRAAARQPSFSLARSLCRRRRRPQVCDPT